VSGNAGNVLLVDQNSTRRKQCAHVLRVAGCHVVECLFESDAERVINAPRQQREWVIAVATSDSDAMSDSLHRLFPSIPLVVLGGRHTRAISGRVSIEGRPGLNAQLQAFCAPGQAEA